MTTHNSVLGINTKPMNYILRDNSKQNSQDQFQTLIGNIQEKYMFDTETNNKTCFELRKKLLEFFEGDEEKYNYRKKVYELN